MCNLTFGWVPQSVHPTAADRQTSLTHCWDLQPATTNTNILYAVQTYYYSTNHNRNWLNNHFEDGHYVMNLWMIEQKVKGLFALVGGIERVLPFEHHRARNRSFRRALSLSAHLAWVLFFSPWTAQKFQIITSVTLK